MPGLIVKVDVEVGDEVREDFVAERATSSAHFRPHGEGRWLADLYGLARQRLAGVGIERVSGGGLCTFSDPTRFFSYRRDGRKNCRPLWWCPA